MVTSCALIILKNGKCVTNFCQSDGHEDNMRPILTAFYNNEQIVQEKLVDNNTCGFISLLDNGETNQYCIKSLSKLPIVMAEHNTLQEVFGCWYLWTHRLCFFLGGQWLVSSNTQSLTLTPVRVSEYRKNMLRTEMQKYQKLYNAAILLTNS